jgi:hypothetical protein
MSILGMDDWLREGRKEESEIKSERKIEGETKRKVEGKIELIMYLRVCRDTAAEKKGR